ncbi:PTS sugar transporter subunit IIB [Clostridium sp.]|uniref:PTS system mannose/fructose/N-acetylgalactosamine-transporter subunit IIB n=1 Tax=Clostridium sp. TaxID=1506 RepID=UPI0025C16173|nr:PTS sugar transporter subunit IIB [Clostridium sp.]
MSIKLVRIDDRLIHGQVCSTWIGDYGIEQVLIINDKVSKDPVQKSVVGLAAPSGVRVLVFGVNQFIEVIKKNPIKKDTLLLFTTSTDVLKVVNGGLNIDRVNAGGMRYNETRKKLTKSISVTPEEENAFKELVNKGIEVFIQMVPKDDILYIKDMI